MVLLSSEFVNNEGKTALCRRLTQYCIIAEDQRHVDNCSVCTGCQCEKSNTRELMYNTIQYNIRLFNNDKYTLRVVEIV